MKTHQNRYFCMFVRAKTPIRKRSPEETNSIGFPLKVAQKTSRMGKEEK